jgi:lysophospholipase L1-like esterase
MTGWRRPVSWLLHLALIVYGGLIAWLLASGEPIRTEILGLRIRAQDPGKPILIFLALVVLRALLAIDWRNALLALASTAFALGTVELGLRAIDHPLARHGKLQSWHRAHPTRGYELIPGIQGMAALGYSIRINEHGLRGPTRPFEKPAGVTRLLALGDSFTFGVGVPERETYHAQAARALASEGREVDVVNGGVVGYNLAQSLAMFQELGVKFLPDLVVYGFFFDDVHTVDPVALARAHPAAGHEPREDTTEGMALRKLFDNLYEGWWRARMRAWRRDTWDDQISQRLAGISSVGRDGDYTKAAITPVFAGTLRTLRDAVQASGARLVVMTIPDSVQVDAPERREVFARLGEVCAELGVPFVDPSSRFDAATDPAALYLLPDDAHTSEAGHAAMAAALAPALREALEVSP